ncbi:MAG TPA: hypothetical protein VJ111_01990 [Chitinophagaceae bacterium]|nr:hypothetical protein [Chitinophagaceae bacterium]
MAYEVIILPGAEQDTDEAISWYEKQQKGLGIRFYSLLLDKLEELKDTPQYYYFIHEEYCRITIDPFPYNIIYKIVDSKYWY